MAFVFPVFIRMVCDTQDLSRALQIACDSPEKGKEALYFLYPPNYHMDLCKILIMRT